jgi:site-specific DNA recombinase
MTSQNSTLKHAQIVAASYERVSTLQQSRHGYSMQAQHKNLAEFATENGWILPDNLRFRDGVDEDASGIKTNLTGLSEMLAAAKRGEFQVLVTPDFDRFARTLVKGLVLEEQLRSYGVRLVFQRVPVEDSPEGRLMRNQLYGYAEYEREKIMLRSMTNRQEKARSGKVVGCGPPPYGYVYKRDERGKVYDLTPDPETAPVIKRIFELLVTHSLLEVAEIFNREGVPTPKGGRWHYTRLWWIAGNPVYKGIWTYGKHRKKIDPDDPSVIAVPVAPIVDARLWNQVQESLTQRTFRRRGRQPVELDPYVLRGMLTCGHCQNPLRVKGNNGVRYYLCGCRLPSNANRRGLPNCGLPPVHAGGIEDELFRQIVDVFTDMDNLDAGLAEARARREAEDELRAERIAAIDKQISEQRKRLERLASRVADVDDEFYAAIMQQVKDTSALIDKLATQRAEWESAGTEGLSEVDAAAIRQFVDDVITGLDHANYGELREIYQRLQIKGTVYADPNGIKFGRKHHFRIDWTGAIPLLHNVTVSRKTVKA